MSWLPWVVAVLRSELRARLLRGDARRPGAASVSWAKLAAAAVAVTGSYTAGFFAGRWGGAGARVAMAPEAVAALFGLSGFVAGAGAVLSAHLEERAAHLPVPGAARTAPALAAAMATWAAVCVGLVAPWSATLLVLTKLPGPPWAAAARVAAGSFAAAGVGMLAAAGALAVWGRAGAGRVAMSVPVGIAAVVWLAGPGGRVGAVMFERLRGVPPGTWIAAGVVAAALAAVLPPGPRAVEGGAVRASDAWARALVGGVGAAPWGLFARLEILRLWRSRGRTLVSLGLFGIVAYALLAAMGKGPEMIGTIAFFVPFSLAGGVWLPAVGSDGMLLEMVRGGGRVAEYLLGMMAVSAAVASAAGALLPAVLGLPLPWSAAGLVVGLVAAATAVGCGALAAIRGPRLHREHHVALWGHALYWTLSGLVAVPVALALRLGGSRGGAAASVFLIAGAAAAWILLAAGGRRLEEGS